MLPDATFFEVLRRHGVPFVVIGGHAVNFHGYVRATEDADVVWVRSADSERRLLNALAEIDGRYFGKQIDPATGIERLHSVSDVYIQTHPLMMLWTTHGFLDLFDYVPGHPGLDVKDLFDTSVDWNGLQVASLDWLRKMKRAAGRPKDLNDLENLRD